MTAVEQGVPSRNETLSLLNTAYGSWGDQAYFHWKYDQYPNYRSDQHGFYITKDDTLAAFRRVFSKEVVGDGQQNRVFVLGDTAVDPAYRGQGLYSQLHSRTMDFSDDENADRVATFNRKQNLTYDANTARGWASRELPLKMRILSPDVVLQRYATLVAPERPGIEAVVSLIGDRIHMQTSSGLVRLADCFGKTQQAEPKPQKRSVGLRLSDRTITRLVDLACTKDLVEVATEPLSTAVNGVKPAQSNAVHRDRSDVASRNGQLAASDADVVRRQSVSEGEFEAIVDLYADETTRFRRTPADIRHILQYPDCDILLVKAGDDLLGYAVVGPRPNGTVLEGRVLEIQPPQSAVFDRLIAAIERLSVARGYDLIIVFAEASIGPLWAAIDQQVLMWTDREPPTSTLVDSCAVSLYDVV